MKEFDSITETEAKTHSFYQNANFWKLIHLYLGRMKSDRARIFTTSIFIVFWFTLGSGGCFLLQTPISEPVLVIYIPRSESGSLRFLIRPKSMFDTSAEKWGSRMWFNWCVICFDKLWYDKSKQRLLIQSLVKKICKTLVYRL